MKIVTDCGADLSAEEIASFGITVAPLYIQFPEGEVNSADLSADAFYDRLEAMAPDIPTTALPSSGKFIEIFRRVLEATDEILAIHISSGLSGTVQSARLAAQQLPAADITVVDSMTLSGGQRFQVLAAALAAKAGWKKQAILELLDRIRARTEVVYTLETLRYLARGGRIGRVQALAGALLKIKPVIRVERHDGKYGSIGKTRTLRKAQAMMVDHLVDMYGVSEPLWVAVMHGRVAEKAEEFANALQARLQIAKLEIMRISPVLGVHTGPGIFGATVMPMALMEDLS